MVQYLLPSLVMIVYHLTLGHWIKNKFDLPKSIAPIVAPVVEPEPEVNAGPLTPSNPPNFVVL